MNLLSKILIGVFVILCALLFFSNKRANKWKGSSNNYEILAKDSIRHYKTKLGQSVSTIRSLEVSERDLKKGKYISDSLLKDLTRKLKNVKSAVIIDSRVVIDSIPVPFEVPVETPFYRSFKVSEEFYSLSGNVSNTGLTISQITIPNTSRIVIGNRKSGFFKTSFEVSVTNSNPMVETTGLQSQVVTERVKQFGLGAFAGFDYTGSPTAGIGIVWLPNFVRF